MPSAFETDWQAADALFAEAFGVSVGVQRGSAASTTMTAEVVMRDDATMDEVLHSSYQTRDYLIAVNDYQVASVAVEPIAGDRITETINGQVCVFEVAPNDNRRAAQWADSGGTRWLIRTKRVT